MARNVRQRGALRQSLRAGAPERSRRRGRLFARHLPAAGSVFIGPWSAQSVGDYASGTNHVLPTGGGARSRGGLSTWDFVRCTTRAALSRAGLRRLAPVVSALADAEGLGGAPARRRGAQVKPAIRSARRGAQRRTGSRPRRALAPFRARLRFAALRLTWRRRRAARGSCAWTSMKTRWVARPPCCARFAGSRPSSSPSIRSTRRHAAAGAALRRAPGGDAAHQWRGRCVAPAHGHVRRAGQRRADSRADVFDVSLFRRNCGRARRSGALRRCMRFPLEAILRALRAFAARPVPCESEQSHGDAAGSRGAPAHSGCRAAHAGAGGRSILRICGRDGAAVDSQARRIWWSRARFPRPRAWRRCGWACCSRAPISPTPCAAPSRRIR